MAKKTNFEKAYDIAFKKYFDRVEIPIMDLISISAEADRRTRNGEDLNQVMHNISLRYKK